MIHIDPSESAPVVGLAIAFLIIGGMFLVVLAIWSAGGAA